jgi:hypothetical protein
LERLPLAVEYPEVAQHIGMILRRPPLDRVEPKPELIVDATGVGLPVVQILERQGLRPIKVTITGSTEQSHAGSYHWHVGKSLLVSHLDAALHCGVLRFAASLLEGEALKNELQDFQRHVNTAGRASYQARVGKHDDLVLAVSLAVWRAAGNGPGAIFSTPIIGYY